MKILAEYVEDGPDRSGRQFVNRAKFAAVLGDHERAVALLREAGVRGHAFNHWLFFRMDLESLRGYPPFDELARVKD